MENTNKLLVSDEWLGSGRDTDCLDHDLDEYITPKKWDEMPKSENTKKKRHHFKKIMFAPAQIQINKYEKRNSLINSMVPYTIL